MESTLRLPVWQSHKIVSAAKIVGIVPESSETGAMAQLVLEGLEDTPREVFQTYKLRHNPEVGGYYVVYEDGYESYSPAEAFEEGYAKVKGSGKCRVVEPSSSVTFYDPEDGQTAEQAIESAGRTCYKSEDMITPDSSSKFVEMLRHRGHHAMLEFGYARARIIADRGLTHELVRHRLASFAQESTRYCNYSKGKFSSQITVIEQPGLTEFQEAKWKRAMDSAQNHYMDLLDSGVKPEIARSVLPIGLKAEIVIGANLREWGHLFKMRCASSAHPIIRGVMLDILKQFWERMPMLYEDLFEEFVPVKVGDIFERRGGGMESTVISVEKQHDEQVIKIQIGDDEDDTVTDAVSILYDEWRRVELVG